MFRFPEWSTCKHMKPSNRLKGNRMSKGVIRIYGPHHKTFRLTSTPSHKAFCISFEAFPGGVPWPWWWCDPSPVPWPYWNTHWNPTDPLFDLWPLETVDVRRRKVKVSYVSSSRMMKSRTRTPRIILKPLKFIQREVTNPSEISCRSKKDEGNRIHKGVTCFVS